MYIDVRLDIKKPCIPNAYTFAEYSNMAIYIYFLSAPTVKAEQ